MPRIYTRFLFLRPIYIEQIRQLRRGNQFSLSPPSRNLKSERPYETVKKSRLEKCKFKRLRSLLLLLYYYTSARENLAALRMNYAECRARGEVEHRVVIGELIAFSRAHLTVPLNYSAIRAAAAPLQHSCRINTFDDAVLRTERRDDGKRVYK